MNSKVVKVFLLASFWWSNNFHSMAQQNELIILSYNIYHGEDPYQIGRSNIQDIANLINRLQPDLVALQEVDSMTLRTMGINEGKKMDLILELEKVTGMKGFFAKAIDFSEGGYGEAILSRHPAVFESIQLPTPKGGEGRSIAKAHVRLPDGSNLVFSGTHLCHEFDENRTAQVKEIHKVLMGLNVPVVLAGDFNFDSGEKGYSVLEKDFLDAAQEYGNPKNTYSSKKPEIRIDYIWLDKKSNWEIISVEVLDEVYSDHKPLLVKVRLGK
jgi:endonuclease/exonuclease/phosphatase family metal-dependent hydrolase